eukprot:g5029.t1
MASKTRKDFAVDKEEEDEQLPLEQIYQPPEKCSSKKSSNMYKEKNGEEISHFEKMKEILRLQVRESRLAAELLRLERDENKMKLKKFTDGADVVAAERDLLVSLKSQVKSLMVEKKKGNFLGRLCVNYFEARRNEDIIVELRAAVQEEASRRAVTQDKLEEQKRLLQQASTLVSEEQEKMRKALQMSEERRESIASQLRDTTNELHRAQQRVSSAEGLRREAVRSGEREREKLQERLSKVEAERRALKRYGRTQRDELIRVKGELAGICAQYESLLMRREDNDSRRVELARLKEELEWLEKMEKGMERREKRKEKLGWREVEELLENWTTDRMRQENLRKWLDGVTGGKGVMGIELLRLAPEVKVREKEEMRTDIRISIGKEGE